MAGWPGGRWLVSDEPKPVPIQVGWVTVVPVRGQCRGPVPVAGGRWPVAGGLWPVAGGRWPVAGWPGGRWPVAGGGGRWPGRKNDYSDMEWIKGLPTEYILRRPDVQIERRQKE